eukprot:12334765-Karenia_brevis.AAC.1
MRLATLLVDADLHEKLVTMLNLKVESPNVKNAKPDSSEPKIPYAEWWRRVMHSRRLGTWQTPLENLEIPPHDIQAITSVNELGDLIGEKLLELLDTQPNMSFNTRGVSSNATKND